MSLRQEGNSGSNIRRRPFGDGGRYSGCSSTYQGMSVIAGNYQKLEKARKYSSEPPEEVQGLLASRLKRIN